MGQRSNPGKERGLTLAEPWAKGQSFNNAKILILGQLRIPPGSANGWEQQRGLP